MSEILIFQPEPVTQTGILTDVKKSCGNRCGVKRSSEKKEHKRDEEKRDGDSIISRCIENSPEKLSFDGVKPLDKSYKKFQRGPTWVPLFVIGKKAEQKFSSEVRPVKPDARSKKRLKKSSKFFIKSADRFQELDKLSVLKLKKRDHAGENISTIKPEESLGSRHDVRRKLCAAKNPTKYCGNETHGACPKCGGSLRPSPREKGSSKMRGVSKGTEKVSLFETVVNSCKVFMRTAVPRFNYIQTVTEQGPPLNFGIPPSRFFTIHPHFERLYREHKKLG